MEKSALHCYASHLPATLLTGSTPGHFKSSDTSANLCDFQRWTGGVGQEIISERFLYLCEWGALITEFTFIRDVIRLFL